MAWWEIIFMLVILKIPIGYVGWVIWWAIKAEPEVGVEGGTEGVNWTPWRTQPRAGRPDRGPSRGRGPRDAVRAARRRERSRA